MKITSTLFAAVLVAASLLPAQPVTINCAGQGVIVNQTLDHLVARRSMFFTPCVVDSAGAYGSVLYGTMDYDNGRLYFWETKADAWTTPDTTEAILGATGLYAGGFGSPRKITMRTLNNSGISAVFQINPYDPEAEVGIRNVMLVRMDNNGALTDSAILAAISAIPGLDSSWDSANIEKLKTFEVEFANSSIYASEDAQITVDADLTTFTGGARIGDDSIATREDIGDSLTKARTVKLLNEANAFTITNPDSTMGTLPKTVFHVPYYSGGGGETFSSVVYNETTFVAASGSARTFFNVQTADPLRYSGIVGGEPRMRLYPDVNGDTLYFIVSQSGAAASSRDGITWDTVTGLGSINLADHGWNEVEGVVVGSSEVCYRTTTFESGSFVACTINPTGTQSVRFVVWFAENNLWVAGGTNGFIYTDPTGEGTWTERVAPGGSQLWKADGSSSLLVAVGAAGAIVTSDNGTSYTTRVSNYNDDLFDVVWTGTRYVAVGDSGVTVNSTDGITWSRVNGPTYPNNIPLIGIAYGDGVVTAVGTGIVITSSDHGQTWTRVANVSPGLLGTVGNGELVRVTGLDSTLTTAGRTSEKDWSITSLTVSDTAVAAKVRAVTLQTTGVTSAAALATDAQGNVIAATTTGTGNVLLQTALTGGSLNWVTTGTLGSGVHTVTATSGTLAAFNSTNGQSRVNLNAVGTDFDAQINFMLDNATIAAMGIDDTDADAFVVSFNGNLGTTNAQRWTSTGTTIPGTLGVTGAVALGSGLGMTSPTAQFHIGDATAPIGAYFSINGTGGLTSVSQTGMRVIKTFPVSATTAMYTARLTGAGANGTYTTTEVADLDISAFSKGDNQTITTYYGIRVGNVPTAGTAYAIQTGTGTVRFGSLAGTGTRNVIVNANGDLSAP